MTLAHTTLAQAHRRAKQYLMDAGQTRDEAHLTARLLLDHITSTRHAHLTRGDENFESALDATQHARFETALEELQNGRPLAYVLGEREWFGLKFKCDERALIPRPETELLVETALSELQNAKCRSQVADLGTGTGCIAVALAVQLPRAEIFATDVSGEALSLARLNASTHGVADRIRFIEGNATNWSSPLSLYNGAFDVVCSNPPYIASRGIETLQVEIRNFEPRGALDGGGDGLDCYRQLASQCRVLVRPGGALICELGAGQWKKARAVFEAEKWRVAEPIFDAAGIARVLVARLN